MSAAPGGDFVSAAVSLDGTPGPIRLAASLTCPSCAGILTGHWLAGRETAEQQCGACGHVFTATWPGWAVEPETIVITREPRHGAA